MTDISATLVAHTTINRFALAELGYHPHDAGDLFGTWSETDADELAEFAGRNCYLSFHRPNPATAGNADYLAHIHENGHESVEEHASATFYIHASRSVLAELSRHRHLSFSVVSQRYVDSVKQTSLLHIPPAISELEDDEAYNEIMSAFHRASREIQSAYETAVTVLTEQGKPRKQAREAARAVLPQAIDSPMVVTGNMRAWKHVIRMRHHQAADAEIRELARQILEQLRGIAPNTFQDIPEEPFV